VLQQVGTEKDAVVIGGANGTFVDRAEAHAMDAVAPSGMHYSPKTGLGEGVAAGSLWQVIAGVQALETKQLPTRHYPRPARDEAPGNMRIGDRNEITILSCGMNQHVGAVRLTKT
jgi:3-oxoacyl-(acyl-carrier-protein) synthase